MDANALRRQLEELAGVVVPPADASRNIDVTVESEPISLEESERRKSTVTSIPRGTVPSSITVLLVQAPGVSREDVLRRRVVTGRDSDAHDSGCCCSKCVEVPAEPVEPLPPLPDACFADVEVVPEKPKERRSPLRSPRVHGVRVQRVSANQLPPGEPDPNEVPEMGSGPSPWGPKP